jgi:hypothetical protein
MMLFAFFTMVAPSLIAQSSNEQIQAQMAMTKMHAKRVPHTQAKPSFDAMSLSANSVGVQVSANATPNYKQGPAVVTQEGSSTDPGTVYVGIPNNVNATTTFFLIHPNGDTQYLATWQTGPCSDCGPWPYTFPLANPGGIPWAWDEGTYVWGALTMSGARVGLTTMSVMAGFNPLKAPYPIVAIPHTSNGQVTITVTGLGKVTATSDLAGILGGSIALTSAAFSVQKDGSVLITIPMANAYAPAGLQPLSLSYKTVSFTIYILLDDTLSGNGGGGKG